MKTLSQYVNKLSSAIYVQFSHCYIKHSLMRRKALFYKQTNSLNACLYHCYRPMVFAQVHDRLKESANKMLISICLSLLAITSSI